MAEPEKVVPPSPLAVPAEAKSNGISQSFGFENGKKNTEITERDLAFARLASDKRMALIQAWEDNEKTKAENKAYKKLMIIASYENTAKAAVEAQQKKFEEKLEKKKAEYEAKMKNKIGLIQKAADERRAVVALVRGEDFLRTEEIAQQYRTAGKMPKKICSCFGVFSTSR